MCRLAKGFHTVKVLYIDAIKGAGEVHAPALELHEGVISCFTAFIVWWIVYYIKVFNVPLFVGEP